MGTISDFRSSLDHLVGELLELRWQIKSKCRGGLEVDHEIEPLRALYRQFTWLKVVWTNLIQIRMQASSTKAAKLSISLS